MNATKPIVIQPSGPADESQSTLEANERRHTDATDASAGTDEADERAGDPGVDERDSAVGPDEGLPGRVPDPASEVYDAVESFLDGSIDHLGDTSSGPASTQRPADAGDPREGAGDHDGADDTV